VRSNGGFTALMDKLLAGIFSSAYVVGEDLIGADEKIRAALQKLPFLVVQDTRMTETARLAHVILPAVHFGEKEGTYTNRKGRLQRVNAAVIAPEGARQDSEIFIQLLKAAGEVVPYFSSSEIFAAIAREVSAYRGLDYDSIGQLGVELRTGGGGES
ncbi:MAG TPA: molybdopterin-dependent oxidoreductase, partial [Candidatus Binatus sp.]|nr:molybdopterin-dependent oxidoreductase [Candidatus Binatus sp.]